jgi:hypothetical protein
MMKRGGRLLGEGVYGCAFSPPLLCKGKTKGKGDVGKILRKGDAVHEYAISQALKQIPFSNEYFVIIDDICDIKPRIKQKNISVNECKPLEGVNTDEVKQVTMPFGGRPLGTLTQNLTVDGFLEIGKKLLEAGTLLLIGGIVHSDIHSLNILVDSDLSVRYIDFGVAWMTMGLTLANVSDLEKVFTPAINSQPPELALMCGLLQKYEYSTILAEIGDLKSVLYLLYKLFGISVEKQIQELEQFVRSSISFRESNWYLFYKLYWSKIDSWAIGCILLTTFVNTVTNDEENILMIIKGLCRIDPGLRLDAAEALEMWAPDSKVLALPEVQEWLKKQKATREQLVRKIGVQ